MRHTKKMFKPLVVKPETGTVIVSFSVTRSDLKDLNEMVEATGSNRSKFLAAMIQRAKSELVVE